jgi:biotin carboxyl carrier protein
MDIRKVKKLIELLEESNIGEIEIKEGEESVRISRQGTAPAPMAYAPPQHRLQRRPLWHPRLRLKRPRRERAAGACHRQCRAVSRWWVLSIARLALMRRVC